MRRLLIVPAAALVLLGGPVLATENADPPPATTGEVAVAPSSQTVQPGWSSPTTAVDANLVGVSWQGDPASKFTVEVQHTNGTWSKATTVDGGDGIQADAGTQDAVGVKADPSMATDPVWVGDDATAVRVRLASGQAADVKVKTVDAPSAGAPSGSAGAISSVVPHLDGPDRYLFAGALFALAALLLAVALGWSPWRRRAYRRLLALLAVGALALTACRIPPAANGSVIPNIIPRSQWGARPFGTGPVPCSGPQYASALQFAVVHHTVNSNNYGPTQSAAMVRAIQAYHMDANGYCDIAYHFLIDKYGQIFEGRDGGIDKPVIGGHAGGFNTGSVGVALIGDYSKTKPTDAQWQALVHLLRWRLSVGGVDPAVGTWVTVGESPCNCQRWAPGTPVYFYNRIVWHRDVDFTECPGNAFAGELETLRAQVESGIVIPPTTTTSTSTTSTSTSTTSSTTTTTLH